MDYLYLLISILIFGSLVFIHELGHYICARIFNITIYEFSIGMGPKLFSHTSSKTGIAYSLRAFPVGGFVSMAGESDETDDPNAFSEKPGWQKLIITAAGVTMNFIVGFVVMGILVASMPNSLASAKIASFSPAENSVSSYDSGLRVDDTVISVNNTGIHTGNELIYEIMRNGVNPLTITVIRGGETITLENVVFPVINESGSSFGKTDFKVYAEHASPGNIIKHSFFRSVSTIKMIWESLFDLISGRYGVEAVSGPVGVAEQMVEAAKSGWSQLIYIAVVLSMNLAVFNLLPIPALDGGRMFFILIGMIRGKPINQRIESYINFTFLVILFALIILVSFKDIVGLFN